MTITRDAADALKQERVRLAGCLTAAEGHGIKTHECAQPGDYGWSLAYQAVLDLRRAYDGLQADLESVLVAGNHLGNIIGGTDHPLHTASHDEAMEFYYVTHPEGPNQLEANQYDAWCCWKVIMEISERRVQGGRL